MHDEPGEEWGKENADTFYSILPKDPIRHDEARQESGQGAKQRQANRGQYWIWPLAKRFREHLPPALDAKLTHDLQDYFEEKLNYELYGCAPDIVEAWGNPRETPRITRSRCCERRRYANHPGVLSARQ
jgi:hypothetical protein